MPQSTDITQSTDTTTLWPNGLTWNQGRGQFEGSCPFCNPASTDGAVILTGHDRFFINPAVPGGTCRVCSAQGRGPRGNGWYSDGQIAARFGKPLPDTYVPRTLHIPEQKEDPIAYKSAAWIQEAHLKVDYTYWETHYKWSKDVIDHFLMGSGHVYQQRHGVPQNIIPMFIERLGHPKITDGWYVALRGFDASGAKVKERAPGSSKFYMGIFEENPDSHIFTHTEGDTDHITAWALGYENNGTIFGASNWTDDKAELVLQKGYTKIIILNDNGAAGQTLADNIADSYLKRGITDVWMLDWGSTPEAEISDITDLLKTKSRTEARQWLEQRFVEPAQRSRYRQYNTNQQIVSLDDLRGSGPDSLRYRVMAFIQHYENNTAFHLQAPPGAGKTRVLIKIAEKMAEEQLKARANQRIYLEDKVRYAQRDLQADLHNPDLQEALAKAERQLANLNNMAIAWYGQYVNGLNELVLTGANPDLWYDFQARNAENCQNFNRVQELGANHHDIGYYCRTACPFFNDCKLHGYFKQEEERKSKPITFFRHNHLRASHQQDYKQLLVVDEYAGSVLEQMPIVFKADDIYPHHSGWQLDIIAYDMVDAIIKFAEAVRATMATNTGAPQNFADGSTNQQYILSGAAFLTKLDQHCKTLAGQSLAELMARIDSDTLHRTYQPNFSGAKDDPVLKRCLPQLFDVIGRELADYLAFPLHQFPSCIHLVAGILEVYAPEKIVTRQRTPLIIADGTGIPVLYQAMFRREVAHYAPIIRNPNALTEVIVDNDWTKGQIANQMGAALRDRKTLIKQTSFTTLEGEDFNIADVPVSEQLYNSQLIQHAIGIIKTLAQRHSSLLVVTHKDLREVIESLSVALQGQGQAQLQRVTFAHYGATRGTNRYEDYEAVALLGCFRIPYNIVWRRIQMWANLLGIKEYIPPDTLRQRSPYDYIDKNGLALYGAEHRTFTHDLAQAYVDMLEKGELQQSAARIRPHSTREQKYIYCFATRPAQPFIDKITKQADFLKQTEGNQHYDLYQYMLKVFQQSGKFPSYRSMKTEYGVSNDTIRRIRQQISEQTALVAHNI